MAVILKGRQSAILAEFDRRRMVAYEQAQWIAIAINAPSKLREFKPLALAQAAVSPAEQQRLVDDAKVRGWFISMSMGAH